MKPLMALIGALAGYFGGLYVAHQPGLVPPDIDPQLFAAVAAAFVGGVAALVAPGRTLRQQQRRRQRLAEIADNHTRREWERDQRVAHFRERS
jgi:hypothetical protein